jgi:CheY-like chemotaxis protein
MRVLLAEDNVVNQMVAVSLLGKLGVRADVVANGVEAVKAVGAIPYDLVLMDVQMPEMDGCEATRQIRAAEACKALAATDRGPLPAGPIPILAMTANAMKGDRERCLETGMDDYLTKPMDAEALIKALDKWLPGKKG